MNVPRLHSVIWILGVYFTIGVYQNSACAIEIEDPLSRFQREAREGWAQLETKEKGLEFVVRLTYFHPEARQPESRKQEYLLKWWRYPGCLRLERDVITNNKVTGRKAIVVNPQYEFLTRNSTRDMNKWELGGFSLRKPDDADTRALLVFQAYLYPLTSVLNTNGSRLSQLLSEKDCHIEDAKMNGNHIRVQLNFLDKNGPKLFGKVHLKVNLNPTQNWAVNDYTITSGNDLEIIRKTEWSEKMIGNYRPPSKITIEYRRPKQSDQPFITRIAEFESVKPYSASPDEFRLPAFGFPEPPGVEQPRSWLWPILVGGASTCGLLAVTFWWLAMRKKQRVMTGNTT